MFNKLKDFFQKTFGNKNHIEELENEIVKLKESIAKAENELTIKNESLNSANKNISNMKEELIIKDKNLDSVKANLNAIENELQIKKRNLDFIADVINAKKASNEAFEDYKKLLEVDYLHYANENNSHAEEASCLLKLQEVERELELLTYDDALIKRTIVAIAGSFSSGKSSFMNSFFKSRKVKLPTGMDQTTAISSYVMNGSVAGITGCSFRGGKIDIPPNVFKLFSYGKIEEFNFNMKQIINHIVFKTPFIKDFDSLCFIDTPGFNPGQETETDFNTAITAIADANALLWCFDCSAGTLKDDELTILSEIQNKNDALQIYIIANKADLKSVEECEQIVDEVEMQLTNIGIDFVGIALYSSQNEFTNQAEELNYYKGVPLIDFLESCNVENSFKKKNLLKKVDEVFGDYITADKDRILKLKKDIRTLIMLESNFAELSDKYDDEIAYYKARTDKKKFKKIKETLDTTDEEAQLFDSIADLKQNLKDTIKKDTTDIEKASELCKQMKQAIAKVFGSTLEDETNYTDTSTNDNSKMQSENYNLTLSKFCSNCGTELNPGKRFCSKCGKERSDI